MYGVNLLRLASLVGLRQLDIARHMGITKVQVHYWAQGMRPVSKASVSAVVAFIAEAVERFLANGAAEGRATRDELTAALRSCFEENCQRYGHAPNLEAFMAAIEEFAALSRRQRQDGEKLEDMERRTAAMRFWFELEVALLPLRRLLPDEAEAMTPEPEKAYADTH